MSINSGWLVKYIIDRYRNISTNLKKELKISVHAQLVAKVSECVHTNFQNKSRKSAFALCMQRRPYRFLLQMFLEPQKSRKGYAKRLA